LLTFEFTFLKNYPQLILKTTVKNNIGSALRDVVYTRIWDIDVCTKTGSNSFVSSDHAAYASDTCRPYGETIDRTVQLTIAGHDGTGIVDSVDLDAWDDFSVRSPWNVKQQFTPKVYDDMVGIYYNLGVLNAYASKTVTTVYQSNFPKKAGTAGADSTETAAASAEVVDSPVSEEAENTGN